LSTTTTTDKAAPGGKKGVSSRKETKKDDQDTTSGRKKNKGGRRGKKDRDVDTGEDVSETFAREETPVSNAPGKKKKAGRKGKSAIDGAAEEANRQREEAATAPADRPVRQRKRADRYNDVAEEQRKAERMKELKRENVEDAALETASRKSHNRKKKTQPPSSGAERSRKGDKGASRTVGEEAQTPSRFSNRSNKEKEARGRSSSEQRVDEKEPEVDRNAPVKKKAGRTQRGTRSSKKKDVDAMRERDAESSSTQKRARVDSDSTNETAAHSSDVGAPKFQVGTEIYKEFPGYGWFYGSVETIRGDSAEDRFYRCIYEDGDGEEMEEFELELHVEAAKKQRARANDGVKVSESSLEAETTVTSNEAETAKPSSELELKDSDQRPIQDSALFVPERDCAVCKARREGRNPSHRSHSDTCPENKKKRKDDRATRKQQRSTLRSKATGLGLVIPPVQTEDSSDSQKSSKKIAFADRDGREHVAETVQDVSLEVEEEGAKEQEGQLQHVVNEKEGTLQDGEDDDSVEEMHSGGAAYKEQLDRERAAASAVVKRKRKRKKKESEAKDFDDNFFDKLDNELSEVRKRRKQETSETFTGRHTTFIMSEDDPVAAASRDVGHNIEVVVLGRGGERPSKASCQQQQKEMLEYSRSCLSDGSQPSTQKQIQKMKKSGHKQTAPVWKRSRVVHRKGRGKPAAIFAVRKR
jgi:hypothetical protein